MSEKRSAVHEIAQGDLFGQGVGARHGDPTDPAPGGEYPNNCNLQNFSNPAPAPDNKKNSRDPRFDDLVRIGIPAVWMRIAERVGFDAWLDIWRMISSDDSVRHDGGARLPKLRYYSAYSRFQRNRYIQALDAQGVPPQLIQEAVYRNLGEELDITNITRISRRVRISS